MMKPGVQAIGSDKLDILGIALSVGCAIHCLTLPILAGVLPMIGLGLVADHEFEYVTMAVIFSIAGYTYFKGYREHGNPAIFYFLAVGIIAFLAVRPLIAEAFHPVATLAGGGAFVAGHALNWRWRRCSC